MTHCILQPNGRAYYGIFVDMARYVGNTDNKKCAYFFHKYLKEQTFWLQYYESMKPFT